MYQENAEKAFEKSFETRLRPRNWTPFDSISFPWVTNEDP